MTDFSIVGDIGGTNARFAIVEPGSTELQHIQILQCADYSSISGAIDDYMQSIQHARFNSACIAFACPVEGDTISMSNNHWSFAKRELKEWLAVDRLKILNDFTAMALGVEHVLDADLVRVGEPTQASKPKAKLIIGAGTGLGVSALIPVGDNWLPLTSEGGHVEFAPIDDTEIAIWQFLHEEYGRVSVERLLSGKGIVNIYKALCDIHGQKPEYSLPAEVIEAANNHNDFCQTVLRHFCSVFGRVVGNATLTLGAFGGVYICGGVIPRFLDVFLESDFRQAFEEKGRMKKVLEHVPVQVVTDIFAGLRGAAAAIDHPLLPWS